MKREPIIIDVTPELLEVERPRQVVRAAPKPPKAPRPRSLSAQAREAQRVGRIVQQPDFWVGLIAALFVKGR